VLRRWWNYIKTWFGVKSKEAMDPKIEIEAAIDEARKNDQNLRNEAAKVIAHRTRVADEIQDLAEQVAESKELARQALLKSDSALQAGNAVDAEKWNKAAQSIAMKLTAAQNNLDSMQQQLLTADQQAEQAKAAVQNNAMRLEEISSKRLEMLGQLEQAKMQESVNKAMASFNATIGGDAPSLQEIEDKIRDRMAEAKAKTELTAVTPEGAIAELEREVDLASASGALDELRAELGLGPAPQVGGRSASAPSPPSTPSTPTSSPSTPPSDPPPSSASAPPPGGAGDGTTGGPSQQQGS
jgi:phage shock protein A